MKLTVENLGRIKKADDIEIRPLTVFIGENNTNKTWTAYALFTLLQALRTQGQRIDVTLDPATEARIDHECERILKRAEPMRLEKVVETIARKELVQGPLWIAVGARQLQQAVGGPVAADATAKLELTLREDLIGDIRVEKEQRNVGFDLEYRTAGYEVSETVRDEDGLRSSIRRLALTNFRHAIYLPAERSLLVSTYLSVVQDRQRLPEALIDFALTMGRNGRQVTMPEALETLSAIAGGHIDLDPKSPFTFTPVGTRTRLPLASAASLVKSLAGFVAFFRTAGPGDVLLIDEPEMNAHPKAQAQTAELLAMLANRGITVVVTTHSPYFVQHLGNLMEGSQLSPAKKKRLSKERLHLHDESALIDPKDLAVYRFFEDPKDATTVRVEAALDRSARSIDWDTFSEVSDDVGNTFGRILEMEHRGRGR